MTQEADLLGPSAFEAAFRAIGAERYHNRHPFHALLHNGRLNKGQVQAWALNRYVYQAHIPLKDAALMSRAHDPALRREWIHRLSDHDGDEAGDEGGIARWLRLTDSLGLARDDVTSMRLALPGTMFAVEAYVRFVRERSLIEAVASSLTELFAPTIIADRVSGMLANYDFISREALAYFGKRMTQAPRDSNFALKWVIDNCRTRAEQESALDALRFKCGVLWSQLDALHIAYVAPGIIPPGAFRPDAT